MDTGLSSKNAIKSVEFVGTTGHDDRKRDDYVLNVCHPILEYSFAVLTVV